MGNETDATIVVNRRGADRARRDGHLWIYRSDIIDHTNAHGGAVVRVNDERGRFVAQAFYSDRSEIALRVLTLGAETIDRSWWQKRITDAAKRRATLATDADAYRIVFSESDLLPSIIIDRYKDLFVLQTLSQGAEQLKDLLVETLVGELGATCVVERNDARVRRLEGLELRAGALYGTPPGELEINQHGTKYFVSALGGQKTGAFLDQRENHRQSARYATGRALDCFTFNGAFALSIASSCDTVLGVDVSADAVAAATRNAQLNGIANVTFREANVFDQLREFEISGEKFDTIVLDPPAFAKNRQSLKAAMRGYKEINLRALKLLNPNGTLVTCTCSYHMTESLFLDILTDAGRDARRRVAIIEKRMQASDHPVLVTVPETYYLKCVIAKVLE